MGVASDVLGAARHAASRTAAAKVLVEYRSNFRLGDSSDDGLNDNSSQTSARKNGKRSSCGVIGNWPPYTQYQKHPPIGHVLRLIVEADLLPNFACALLL
jgi:hypothetical protein